MARPPIAPAQGQKRKIKITKNVDGHPVEVEVEVDDTPGLAWPARGSARLLGTDLQRVDAPLKVSGVARYTHDIRVPGMVWARLLVSPLPRAKVAKLDLEPALRTRGVVAAIALQGESVGFLGQPIAAVAAESVEAAEDGLRAIVLELTPQPWAADHETAVKPDAPKVGRGNNVGDAETAGDAGEARAAIDASAARVKATYVVPIQHHACLETHGVVVDWRGGEEATIYCSTQATFSFAKDAADELGLKASNVHGVVEHMGGGFGSKFGLGAEGQAACKLAKQLRRPVHLLLTRRDEFLMAGNRSGTIQTIELGADREGHLTAMIAEAWKHGGLGRGSLARQPYVYRPDGERKFATHRSARSVLMNLDANRAMRAPGHPQASFAMESALDELAYALGIEPLALRLRNVPHPAWKRQLERCGREIGWADHPHKTKPGAADGAECTGIGFAVSTWGGAGNDECHVDVRIERDGSVAVLVGSQDLGTGTRTYTAAIVAEEFGLPLSAVDARIGSTRYGEANGSGGSTTAASLAPSVKDAAFNARQLFARHLAQVMQLDAEGFRFLPEGIVHDRGKSPTSIAWSKACATLPNEGLRASGKWVSDLAAGGVHGAQAAKVRVDPATGRVQVLHMVAVHDMGLCLNRLATKSQIQGGMIQALGYALGEGRVIDPVLGVQLNASFEEYKLPHALEIPRMTVVIDDGDDRNQVIGMSEAAIIPGAGAIANAVHNACGARVRELPITPDKVLAALGRVG